MSQRRIKLLALAMAVGLSLTAGVSAEDLKPHNNELTSIFNGSSFAVLVPENGKLQPAYADLLSLVKPYEKTRLSPKELGALASKIENAMRQMGYTGTIIKIVKAEGGRPLAMSVTYDLNAVKNPKVNREEIIKGLQVAMNEQFKTTANDQQKEPASLKALAEAAPSLKSMAEAEDQRQWVLSTAKSYVEGQVNSTLNTAIGAMVSGANSQITLGYDDEERDMKLSGKVLIPIISDPTYTFFTQTGLTEGDNDRTLFHAGLGLRFYPEAVDFENAGSYMFGINTVYDYDLSRYHRRFSLGGELGYETLSLYGNVYQRLSGWRTSPDFDSGLVEERPANGFDVGAKYALPAYLPLSFKGSYAQWFGEKVSPWGDTDPDNLMNDPHIWSVGLEWTPVPALGLSLTHEIEEGGDTNTEAMLSFNIPLSNAIEDAFNPEMGGVQNTIAGSRNAFIERDYSMPLEYRSKPGKFIISQCGLDAENNNYCFHIQDGFEKPVPGQTVTVVPSDKCVIMSQGGNYITDGNGNIHAAVDSSCVNHTVVDVGAGSTNKEFPIEIGNIAINYAITPPMMELTSDESGVFTLDGGPDAIQIPVKWSLIEGQGKLKDEQTETNSKGQATVTYVADEDTIFDYEATVVATVAGKDFPAFVNVKAATLTMTVPPSTEEDKYTVIVNGGTPSGEFTAETQGPGKVIVPEGGLKFDETGKAEIEIQVQSPAEGTVTITVTDNTSGKQGNGDTVLNLELYAPEIDTISPSYSDDGQTVKANEAFEVTVSGLLPGSEVIYREVNGVKPVDGSTVSVKVSEDGTAVLKYQAITDPNIISFIPDLDYARDLADTNDNDKLTHWDDAPEINVHQYALTVDAPASTENGTYEVTVTGGKPGEEVSFEINGHGTLDKDKAVFDSNGEAVVTVTVTLPAEGNIIVTASSNGHSAQDLTSIDLFDYAVTANIDYPNFTPTGGTLQDKTVDFNRPFIIHAKGLLPNSSINVTSDGYGVPSGMTKGLIKIAVDEKGECDIPYEAIKNPAIKDFTVVYQYAINEADLIDQGQFNGAFVSDKIKVWQYDLTISAPEAADDGQNFEIEVSGGQPNEEVLGEIGSGQGSITCDPTFNTQGIAHCTVNPEDSYDGKIDITVSGPNGKPGQAQTDTGLANYDSSLKIDYPSFTPVNGTEQEKTVDFEENWQFAVSGLVPNSTLFIDNKGAAIPVNSQIEVNDEGKAVILMKPVTDPTIKDLTVKLRFAKTKAEAANGPTTYTAAKDSETIKVWYYDFALNAVNSLEGDNNSYVVTAINGKPGNKVVWSVSGDNKISGELTFNEQGKAVATVEIITPQENETVSVTAKDTNSQISKTVQTAINLTDYSRTVGIEYPIFVEPNGTQHAKTVSYDQDFSINVSGLLADSTIIVHSDQDAIPQGGDGMEITVGSDGTAQIPYKKITNTKALPFKVIFSYAYNKADLTDGQGTYDGKYDKQFISEEISVFQYNLQITIPKEPEDGSDFEIEISGGKPNDPVTGEVEDGQGTITCDPTFNAQGIAHCTVNPDDGYDGEVNIKVEGSGDETSISQDNNLINYTEISIDYPSFTPVNQSRKDNTIEFTKVFSIPVHGLLPNSTISVKPYNAGAFTVTPVSSEVTANENGDAVIDYEAITTVIDSFKVEFGYYLNLADQANDNYSQDFTSEEINVFAYQPEITAVTTLTADDHTFQVLVNGGSPNSQIQWEITGDGEFSTKDATFDANGNADAVIGVIPPGVTQIEITATDLSSGLSDSHITTLNLNAYGASLIPPVYDKGGIREENTVDIEEQFELVVEGLKPGTTATVTGTGVFPADGETSSYQVGEDGRITIPYDAITNGTAQELGLKIEYVKNSSGQTEVYETTVKIHNYILKIDGPTAADNGLPYEIEVSGGRPNGDYTASVDHGEIYCQRSKTSNAIRTRAADSHQYSFNEIGSAFCTITPEAGYAGNITVTIEGSGDTEQKVTNANLMTYRPQIEYADSSSIDGVQGRYDYNEPFIVYVTGLLDGSQVQIDGLPSGVTVKNKNLTANGGRASIEFNAVTTASSFTFDVKYFKNKADQANNTFSVIENTSMTMKEYSIKFASKSQTDLDGSKPSNIYLEGGKEGETITWTITGDGNITPATGYFDGNGEAPATVTGKGAMTSAVTVTARTMGKTIQLTMNFVNYGLRFISLPSFTNVDAQTFRNTVDNNEAFEVEVNRARPGSVIKWSSSLATPDKATTVAAADGTSSMSFKPIKNLDDTSVTISAEYERNASIRDTTTANLRLHQYEMQLDLGDGKIDAYSNPGNQILDKQVLNISGGKPDHKAVITLTGSGTVEGAKTHTFTFDDHGEADLTVISEANFANDINVKITPADASFTNSTCSGKLGYSFDSWTQTPAIDQNSLKDPSISAARTIDVEKRYTFIVNGVYPNTDVVWSTSDSSAKLASTTTKADKNGRATVTLNPVTDYDLEKFTLTAKVYADPRTQKDLKAEVNVKQYTITLDSSKSTIDAYDGKGIANANLDAVTVNVKGGRSGSALQWTVTGDGQLDYSGKTSGSGTFNSKGEATIKVYAKKSFNKNPTLTVTGLGSTKSQVLTYDLTTYNPTLTLPSYSGTGGTANVDYGKTYTVKLAGGMPGTTVTWKTTNSVIPDKATSTVATDGTASMTFKAITDFDVLSEQVSATINTSAIKTASKSATLKLPAYPLSFSYADGNLDAYSKSTAKLDTETVTLKGGKENMQVTVTVGGNATLVVNGRDATSQTITLNKSGQGVLTVRSKTPFTSAPTLKVTGPGNRVASGSLKYVLSKASMKVTLPTYSSTLYGTEANTADYGEDYDVTVSGLLPGTVITPANYKNSSLKDTKAQTVGTNGTVVLHYNGVKTRDDVGVQFTYVTQGAKTTTYQGTVGIHNYNLELSTSKTSIVADESFTATVSGGKPGENVTFTLTGDGVLSSGGKTTSTTFNNKGQATINVAGSTPYNSTIFLTVKSLENSKSSSVNFIVLPIDDFVKYLNMGDANLSKAHCSAGYAIEPFSSAPSSGVICGGDYLGRGKITFTIPYGEYVTNAYFNITISDNRTDFWVNSKYMGAWDAGDNDWGFNDNVDITDLVKQSNGEITVDIEKWCRGGCGWTAKIVASYK